MLDKRRFKNHTFQALSITDKNYAIAMEKKEKSGIKSVAACVTKWKMGNPNSSHSKCSKFSNSRSHLFTSGMKKKHLKITGY